MERARLLAMTVYLLEAAVRLAAPREEVFPFFSDAANLELLTPPWLSFDVTTERPITMRVGTQIDYRLGLAEDGAGGVSAPYLSIRRER